MNKTPAYAAFDKSKPLGPFTIERREPGSRDLQFDIKFCGVCHSDLHTARGEWADTVYPCVPGHEIVGQVTKVGGEVKKFRAGDLVALGCMVSSCGVCASCREGLENYCDNNDVTFTYNSPDKHQPGKPTYGGYSTQIVVDEGFCLHIPESLPKNLGLAGVAPLLCAGITLYSPLKHWGAGRGKKVGIVGLGGLGHMGVKLSHALGAHTVLFTTSLGKSADGKRLGADEVVVSKNPAELEKHVGSFDLIIDTAAVSHDLDAYTALLKREGTLVLIGAPENPHPSPNVRNLIGKRLSIAGSLIGGIPETQEMLNFCAAHNIVSDIELIPIQKIDEAYDRMVKGDVKYRFVVDIASLKA